MMISLVYLVLDHLILILVKVLDPIQIELALLLVVVVLQILVLLLIHEIAHYIVILPHSLEDNNIDYSMLVHLKRIE